MTHRPTDDRPINFEDFKWPYLREGSSIHFMFGSIWGFRGRQIEWRYFRFDQIQDGGRAVILENSNCDISATDHPIHSVFGSRVGVFRVGDSADRMTLYRVGPNSIGVWKKTIRDK